MLEISFIIYGLFGFLLTAFLFRATNIEIYNTSSPLPLGGIVEYIAWLILFLFWPLWVVYILAISIAVRIKTRRNLKKLNITRKEYEAIVESLTKEIQKREKEGRGEE